MAKLMQKIEQFAIHWLGRAALGVVLAGMYLPVGMTFVYSFNASRIGTVWTGFSLNGYRELLGQRDLWRRWRRACAIGAAASSISVRRARWRRWAWRWRPRARAAGPGGARAAAGDARRDHGAGAGDVFQCPALQQGFGTVVAAHCVFGISYAFVVMLGAVQDLDETLYAAALDCGATPWQAFWRVIVPILTPSLVVAWLFVFALSFDDFLITFMTKGPGTDTLPIKIYAQMRFGIKPQTSAMFVLLFLVTLSRGARGQPADAAAEPH